MVLFSRGHLAAWGIMIKRLLQVTKLKSAINRAAKDYKIPFELVCSIIWKESKGDRRARRYEDGFFTRYLLGKSERRLGGPFPARISRATELRDRAYSYGLMQIMGQTARELGFIGDDLMQLCKLEINLNFGCKKLKRCIEREPTLKVAIARYNGDPKDEAPITYALDVLRIWNEQEYLKLFVIKENTI